MYYDNNYNNNKMYMLYIPTYICILIAPTEIIKSKKNPRFGLQYDTEARKTVYDLANEGIVLNPDIVLLCPS